MEKRIPVNYQIKVSEFEEIRKVIAAKYGNKYSINQYVGQIIISNFAYDELRAEQAFAIQNKLKSVQLVRYREIKPTDNKLNIRAEILPKKLTFMIDQLRYLYYPIFTNKSTKINNFLANIGFVFAKHLENGQIKLKLES